MKVVLGCQVSCSAKVKSAGKAYSIVHLLRAVKSQGSHKKQGSKVPPAVATGNADQQREEEDLLTGIDMTLLHRYTPVCTWPSHFIFSWAI